MTTSSSPYALSQLRLPAYEFLSAEVKGALEAFIAEGNRALREQQLTEFLKAVDWLPLNEIPKHPLKKMPLATQRIFLEGLQGYLSDKAQKKRKSAEKRKEHTLNVYDYYRKTMSTGDKALLESLRDYELNRTGRDVNWQHYFSFKSYKKIDEFIQESVAIRTQRIEAFKRDVETYVKNKAKLEGHGCFGEDTTGFNFDDWCDWVIHHSEETQETQSSHHHKHHTHHKNQRSSPIKPTSPLEKAYSVLQLHPQVTNFQDVKKQFRQLTLKFHPDMPGGNTERMKELIGAYETIKRFSEKQDFLRKSQP
jgi:hypothetical protein